MIALAFAWFAGAAFAASLAFFLYSYLVTFGEAPQAAARLLPLVADVSLFSGFAFHHSLFARTPVKRLIGLLAPPHLERSVYTVVSSVLFVLVCMYWQLVPGVLYRLEGWWQIVAWVSLGAGVVVTGAGARALDVLELAGVRQVLNARSRPPSRRVGLKTDGVYGLVRHPIYFGWVLLMLGVPTMTMTRAAFAVISTVYLAVAIPFEERGLGETFGAEYASYQQKVRWRMIPGLY